jgi:hypothetical protein
LCFLVHDLLIQLLEEQGKLGHGLLDALDVVVARANSAKDGGRLSAAVALELQTR